MHRISKNQSQFSSPHSVSDAEKARSSNGNRSRARSPFPLGSSPLAKRRREEAGEAQKSNSGDFDKTRFNEVDKRIHNLYEQYGITTDMNSLTVDDSNSLFTEEFEATYPSHGQDGVLESDYFPLEMSCDSESQERLEERGENQSDSAEDALADLPNAYTDDLLADQDSEMSLEGESEADPAALSSGVAKLPPGQKRMKINHNALQDFIKATSLDLSMSRNKLRDKYIEKYGEESCPGLTIFSKDLQSLRDEWVKKHPNQPKLWQQHINVDHEALQDFIKTTSSDLSMSAEKLRKAYIKTYGKELCPDLDIFARDLRKLRGAWVKKHPNQPKLWQQHINVDHEAIQDFIKDTSSNLTMSRYKLREAYIKKYGEELCPSLFAFEGDLQKLRAEWVKTNLGQPTPWEKHKKVTHNESLLNNLLCFKSTEELLSYLSRESEANHARPSPGVEKLPPGQKRMSINHKALQDFIKKTSPNLSMTSKQLRDKYIEVHGEKSCLTERTFCRALKNLRESEREAKAGRGG